MSADQTSRVLQLTDLHLFAEPDGRLREVPTRASLVDVLELVRSDYPVFDRLVLTGDLADDERKETYEIVREMLGEWIPHVLLIPGNHDNRAAIREVFFDRVPAGDGPITFDERLGAWRLIGLDSHVPGEIPGRIDAGQLDWLRERLAEDAERPTAVFVHHPPVSINSAWLDRIGLENPAPLMELIEGSPQVRLVVCGHVHMEHAGRIGGAEFLATPSTCLQFKPGADEPTYDAVPPGFRVFDLGPIGCRTQVVRLAECRYPPGPPLGC